jgi:D-psicose/D-tagatose/L-ribulose 3-epimerase
VAFSINLLCLSGFVTDEHLPELERVGALGYDGVEIPVLSGLPEDYARLGRRLDALGLRRTCTSIVPSPEANPLSADREVRARGRAHLDWALDCAVALGSESVGGPFHAPIGHFTGSGPSEDEIRHGADEHRRMAERAGAAGLYLSLEALNRFETHFLNTMEQARAYADRVDHAAFRIMYDTFHANIEEQRQPAAIATIAPRLGVVHISENDRGIPGRGHIDFQEIFAALDAAGHDGWIVVEAFGAGLPELAAATRVWRPLFPDHDTLFAESIAFLRRHWPAGPA